MPIDKQAHFWAGAAIAAIVALYSGLPMLGLAAAVVGDALKELRDRAGHGTPDIRDFLATAAGACAVLPLIVMGGSS